MIRRSITPKHKMASKCRLNSEQNEQLTLSKFGLTVASFREGLHDPRQSLRHAVVYRSTLNTHGS